MKLAIQYEFRILDTLCRITLIAYYYSLHLSNNKIFFLSAGIYSAILRLLDLCIY